jgi:hypothetical protein
MQVFCGLWAALCTRLPWTLAASAARAGRPKEVSDRDKCLSMRSP